MSETNEITNNIREVIFQTEAGEINWQRRSATTFSWLRRLGDDRLQLSLQKLKKRNRATALGATASYIATLGSKAYVLQITNLNDRTTLLSVDSSEEPEYEAVLNELFDLVETTAKRRGIHAFDRLLGGDEE